MIQDFTYFTVTRKLQSYIGKESKQDEDTRTRVDECKPFKHLVGLIKDSCAKFKKHLNYIDNCSKVFPLMKDAFTEKFTESELLQKLALGPKLQAQSAHFFRKQYTCHCAIVEPMIKNTIAFVDQILKYLIVNYNISNGDLWIHKDIASSQYKSKHSFGLLPSLTDEFNLRVIRKYGTAGHGKRAIDAMPNNLCEMVEYFASKNPQYYHSMILVESLVMTCQVEGNPKKITGSMKQHLIVFLVSQKLPFRLKKQTRKNVADKTFTYHYEA